MLIKYFLIFFAVLFIFNVSQVDAQLSQFYGQNPEYLASLAAAVAADDAYTVVPDESIFAVITHRAGAGAVLAHDHLIHAGKWDVEMVSETGLKPVGLFMPVRVRSPQSLGTIAPIIKRI